jgi:hypothetical protein
VSKGKRCKAITLSEVKAELPTFVERGASKCRTALVIRVGDTKITPVRKQSSASHRVRRVGREWDERGRCFPQASERTVARTGRLSADRHSQTGVEVVVL